MDRDRTAGSEREPAGFGQNSRPNSTEAPWPFRSQLDPDQNPGIEGKPAGFGLISPPSLTEAPSPFGSHDIHRPYAGQWKGTRWLWAPLTAQVDGAPLAFRMPRWTLTELRQSKGTRWLWAELTAQVHGAPLAFCAPGWTSTELRQ